MEQACMCSPDTCKYIPSIACALKIWHCLANLANVTSPPNISAYH